MPLAPEQCRAARGLLNWSQSNTAGIAKVARATLAEFELGRRTPYDRTLDDIQSALEAAGSEFTNGDQPGVRLRKQREDRKNLEEHISHLETKIADLKPAASAKPSPVKGMAMLRRGRAKSDLAKAKNKRQKENA